jgi:hypothetical protein
MTLQEDKEARAASMAMTDFVSTMSGLTAEREDTDGNTVRDERGRFVKDGLDGGQRGEPMRPPEDGTAVINRLIRGEAI